MRVPFVYIALTVAIEAVLKGDMMVSRGRRTARQVSLIVAVVAVCVSDADGRERGIPKSAPAFAKFVAGFIEAAMPSAHVTIPHRLQLDVQTPNGAHTSDLHNLYAICQRDRDTCIVQVTTFVGQMVEVYKAGSVTISRDTLRIVVRPSAYIAAVRANPKRNRPIAEQIAGDYWALAVIDQATSLAVLDEADLSLLKLSRKDALALAKANTRAALQHPVETELAKGPCRGILGGEVYTASAFAFPELWGTAAHRCHNDLLVAVPATDVILYTEGDTAGARRSIIQVADDVMAHELKPFSHAVFRWSPHGWIPSSN